MISSQNGRLQTSGIYVQMVSRNHVTIAVGGYYVIQFNFPIRNNGMFSGACIDPSSGNAYGDAYYHLNLWVIVCHLNQRALGTQSDGTYLVNQNLRITNFYTPHFYLSAAEQVVRTYSYHYVDRYTTVGSITDGYPN